MSKNKEIIIKNEHTLEDLTSVAKTIMPLAKQLLGAKGMLEMEILADWSTIVGDELAQFSMPKKISFRKDERCDGTLEIFALNGAFATEIQHREPQILTKLNTYFGYDAIAKLKIIQNSCPENFALIKKPIDKVKKNLVSQEERNYITELIKDIDNNELRQRLQNLGEAVLSNTKS